MERDVVTKPPRWMDDEPGGHVTFRAADPAYRALRHLTTVIDAEVIAAEEMQRRGRADRDAAAEGRCRLAALAKLQAVLARDAAKIAAGEET